MRCAIAQPCCGSAAMVFRTSMSRVPWSRSVGGGMFPRRSTRVRFNYPLVDCQGESDERAFAGFSDSLVHWLWTRPMPRIHTLLVAVALCAAGLGAGLGTVAPAAPAKDVVAYVFPQHTALQPGQVDGKQLTRINYAFANIVNGRMVTGFEHDAENFSYLDSLKKENPSLTVLVS